MQLAFSNCARNFEGILSLLSVMQSNIHLAATSRLARCKNCSSLLQDQQMGHIVMFVCLLFSSSTVQTQRQTMFVQCCWFHLTPTVEPTTPNADDSILCGTHRTALLESGTLQRNPVTPLSPGNRETDCNQTSDPDSDFAEWSWKRPWVYVHSTLCAF